MEFECSFPFSSESAFCEHIAFLCAIALSLSSTQFLVTYFLFLHPSGPWRSSFTHVFQFSLRPLKLESVVCPCVWIFLFCSVHIFFQIIKIIRGINFSRIYTVQNSYVISGLVFYCVCWTLGSIWCLQQLRSQLCTSSRACTSALKCWLWCLSFNIPGAGKWSAFYISAFSLLV